MKNKPLAAIDIGTNTCRLLIANVHFDPKKKTYCIKELFSDRIIARLGEGLHKNKRLNKQAMTRGLKALRKFSDTLSEYNVTEISAVATSALREAKNRNDFLAKVKEASGLDIKIISGEEEARITALGMLTDFAIPKAALLVDIGGGSTELIFAKNGKHLSVHSLNLGVVNLAGRYMKDDPPSQEDLIKMDSHISRKIRSNVNTYLKLIDHHSKLKTAFIGTAGTITALAAITKKVKKFEHKKIHGTRITREKVKNIFNNISAVTSKERAKYLPFEPSRLDIIVPGTLILLKLMETFDFREITVSNHGLKEGILIELYKKINE
ncbi:MAG: Ppx/GppA family phosphatase [Nitrospirae bacterium]|nr:Ppx/GppA family phosphatase [Nitrospirota bacterium]